MDFVGRIVFDRVRESLMRIGTRPALTYRVDTLDNYCKSNSVIKCMSSNEF